MQVAQVLHFGCVGVVIFARDVGKENKIFMRSYVRPGIACELLTHIRRRRRRSALRAASFTHARAFASVVGGNIWNGMSKGGARGGEGEGACAEEK